MNYQNGILNIFEVVLRNAIDNHYKAYFADGDWIRDQLSPSGMLAFHPQKESTGSIVCSLINSGRYSNDRIVSSVSMGFWTYLFTKEPFRRGGKTLLKVFPGKDKGQGQRVIYNELQQIKAFRNRIAHHEAICFDESGVISTQTARENYNLILKYIKYLGYSETQLCFGLDVLPNNIMSKIDKLL